MKVKQYWSGIKIEKWKLSIHQKPEACWGQDVEGSGLFYDYISVPFSTILKRTALCGFIQIESPFRIELIVFICMGNKSFSLCSKLAGFSWHEYLRPYTTAADINLSWTLTKKKCLCQQKVRTTLGFPIQGWSPWCVINQQERCAFCKETPRGHFSRCDQSPPCWSCCSDYHSTLTGSSRGRNKTVSVNV